MVTKSQSIILCVFVVTVTCRVQFQLSLTGYPWCHISPKSGGLAAARQRVNAIEVRDFPWVMESRCILPSATKDMTSPSQEHSSSGEVNFCGTLKPPICGCSPRSGVSTCTTCSPHHRSTSVSRKGHCAEIERRCHPFSHNDDLRSSTWQQPAIVPRRLYPAWCWWCSKPSHERPLPSVVGEAQYSKNKGDQTSLLPRLPPNLKQVVAVIIVLDSLYDLTLVATSTHASTATHTQAATTLKTVAGVMGSVTVKPRATHAIEKMHCKEERHNHVHSCPQSQCRHHSCRCRSFRPKIHKDR